MITLDEAFAKFKSRQELTEREQDNVANRHTKLREHVAAGVRLDEANPSFLTGSYKRWTKTRPLKDVDVFCVLHEHECHFRDTGPNAVLEYFKSLLESKYGEDRVTVDQMSVVIDFGVAVSEQGETDDKVMSIEVIPAFTKNEHFEIPDNHVGRWIETNPKIHEELAVDAHAAYAREWKPLVRMIKKWNETQGYPLQPSFLIEVMALELLVPPFSGGYPYELKAFFANAAEHVHDTWADPAELGPPVSEQMDNTQTDSARKALWAAEELVSRAILQARQGKTGEALRTWRQLFGPHFPLS